MPKLLQYIALGFLFTLGKNFFIHAQSKQDSLQMVIQSGAPVEKLEAMAELAGTLVDDSLAAALYWYDSALVIARTEELPSKQAFLLERKGVAYDIHGDFENAIIQFENSLQLYLKHDPKADGLINLYLNYGVAYYYNGDNTRALTYYLKGHELSQDKKITRTYSFLVNNIGNVYKKIHQYDDAIRFFEESVRIKEALDNQEGVANSLFNIGMIYSAQKKEILALQYLQQAKDKYTVLGQKKSIGTIDLAMADVYYRLNDYRRSEQLLMPLATTEFVGLNQEDRMVGHLLLAGIYNENNRPQKALDWLWKLERQLDKNPRDQYAREISYQKSLAYAHLGNYRAAYNAMDTAYNLEKRLNEESNQNLMQEMQVRFTTQEKEKQIVKLQADKKYTDLELKNSRRLGLYFIIGASLFAVIAALLWLQYRKIQRQKIAIAKSMEERSRIIAMDSMIEGQEAERLRIAKDLHDGLGGLLSTIKSHFSALGPGQGTANEKEIYEKTNKLIDEACIDVRRISHNMVPHTLSLSGLEAALEDMAANIKMHGLECKMELKDIPENMTDSRAAMIYRIIQELVQNVIRHAQATEIFLQVIVLSNQINITVEDNGKGFDVNNNKVNGGLGLSSIHSRVKYLDGNLQYDTAPGRGTTVNIEIPLQ